MADSKSKSTAYSPVCSNDSSYELPRPPVSYELPGPPVFTPTFVSSDCPKSTPAALKSPSLEEEIALLQADIEMLESENQTLEDAFISYQRGMERITRCYEILDRVEKQIQIMSEDGAGVRPWEQSDGPNV
ncbi:MAG: exodeoxyribonuclease VII small subunit [Clostridium sp.]|jgi:exodeoxyribonuclease VII small subunit|nr:exodeoxyribonuclease VII small subunit [Clostridium sp.]